MEFAQPFDIGGQVGFKMYAEGGLNRRILVVEDDGDSREVFCEVLRNAGFACVSARNGREALASLRGAHAPDLILLDMFMPRMDGWQFRREQLADAALARIPVIVVSGARATRRSAIGFGAVGFLEKPVRPAELLNAVGKVT
jgi:CheY-like chemotaxis protein